MANFRSLKAHDKNLIKKNLPNDLVKLIVEIIFNIENGNLKLDQPTRNKINKYKSKMQTLFSPQNNKLKNRKKIIQSGGFPFAPLLSLVGPQIISYLLSKI